MNLKLMNLWFGLDCKYARRVTSCDDLIHLFV